MKIRILLTVVTIASGLNAMEGDVCSLTTAELRRRNADLELMERTKACNAQVDAERARKKRDEKPKGVIVRSKKLQSLVNLFKSGKLTSKMVAAAETKGYFTNAKAMFAFVESYKGLVTKEVSDLKKEGANVKNSAINNAIAFLDVLERCSLAKQAKLFSDLTDSLVVCRLRLMEEREEARGDALYDGKEQIGEKLEKLALFFKSGKLTPQLVEAVENKGWFGNAEAMLEFVEKHFDSAQEKVNELVKVYASYRSPAVTSAHAFLDVLERCSLNEQIKKIEALRAKLDTLTPVID